MPRFVPPFLVAVLAVLAALPAQAAEAPAVGPAPEEILSAKLSTDRASGASCITGLRGTGGAVATRQVTLDRAGYLFSELKAASGDWDLAVYDASGRRVSGGASPAASEVASGYVAAGTYTLQGCRRSGKASRAALVADFTPLPTNVTSEKTQMVSVKTPTRAAKDRLVALGVDLTEHGDGDGLGVLLHGAADAQKLRRAGFTWEVEVPDLAARSLRDRSADQRYAASVTRSALPSGRDSYRTLENYNSEMMALAEKNPGLVRLIELPHKTWEGRTVLGIEITTNVNVANGKPAFLNMGLHHAREWPSGEHAMEWAYELINGFNAGDARATKVVTGSRNFVVPVVNPDGFNASRTAGSISGGDGGRDESVEDTAYLVAGAANGGEYRRKNCRLPDDSEGGNCATSAGIAEPGVDPNRNYGGLWGGAGADATNVAAQTYRGPGPFSEPETRNVKALVGGNQVMTLITNHTTAGLVLRAPGIASLGDAVDEQRGYKALGDELALHNGYFSQKSFELYDTTGTTEDWTYNTAGGFGFTFEIYCGAPNYETGDCDDPAFHPLFATMVKEWTGDNDQANHVNDPGRSETAPFGNVAGFDGKGNREAYYIAAESTLNEARHSIIEGAAPAGATLRIRKEFKTETSPQPQADGSEKPILFDDSLESVYEVGSSGEVRWHTNPSTRPIVAKNQGDPNGGEPAPPEQQTGGPQGSSGDANDDAMAAPGGGENMPPFYNEHRITVPATGDNRSANIRVSWPTVVSDWDITLFEDTDGNGDVSAGDKEVGTSAQGATSEEEVGITGTPTLAAGKPYILRVTNFAAGEPYDVDITWNGPEPFKAAQVESWTLTCEVGGNVLQTTQVQVDRGQIARPDLSQCRGAAASAPGATPPGTGSPAACRPATGFRSVSVRGRRAGLVFGFNRRLTRPVGVDVFQVSSGRKVLRARLMARFRGRTKGFVWNGRSNQVGRRVTNGYYFARFRMQLGGKRADVRRTALRRSGGRFTVRPSFFRRRTCGLVRWHKLTSPVFGGRTSRNLRASYRLNRAGRVTVTVTRGGKVVRRYPAVDRPAGKVFGVSLDAKKFKRGVYRVKLVVRDGSKTKRSTLTARRI